MNVARILTYHSGNIAGNDYATNNLVALSTDLEILLASRFSVVPLRAIADAVVSANLDALPERTVAITLDDGLDFDFLSLVHPVHGQQRSVHDILAGFSRKNRFPLHATSFVIASPDARRQVAQQEMRGHQWINESWWKEAVQTGYFHIGNHSWDHMSPSVDSPPGESGRRGSSKFIDNPEAAERQVRNARQYIEQRAPNPGSALLAYPYGDHSAFLTGSYLPHHQDEHGTIAAFTSEPAVVTADSDRWLLPRYMCGLHWNSPESFAMLLRDD